MLYVKVNGAGVSKAWTSRGTARACARPRREHDQGVSTIKAWSARACASQGRGPETDAQGPKKILDVGSNTGCGFKYAISGPYIAGLRGHCGYNPTSRIYEDLTQQPAPASGANIFCPRERRQDETFDLTIAAPCWTKREAGRVGTAHETSLCQQGLRVCYRVDGPAIAAVTHAKGIQPVRQLLAPKVGPRFGDEIQLRVRKLPQEED